MKKSPTAYVKIWEIIPDFSNSPKPNLETGASKEIVKFEIFLQFFM